MGKPNSDPSLHHEPHLQGQFELDPSEAKSAARVDEAAARAGLDEHLEHSVWEETSLSPALNEVPQGALTYANWLQLRISEMGVVKSWLITFLLALAAGPWSLLGTFGSMLSGSTPGGCS